MPSLFNAREVAQLLQRIDQLSAEAQPIWGKMSVSQMLAHCQRPFQVASGALPLKKGLMGFLFGKMAKRKLMSDEPFVKNLPTHPNFRIRNNPHFRDEQKKLYELVKDFSTNGPAGIPNLVHPFFGKMTPEEWDRLLEKHLDHHLSQFGV